MLWLCLYFPHWPLQVAERGIKPQKPLVLVRNARVSHANASARQTGIRPGMRTAAAYALAAGLATAQRERSAEQQALQRLAAWAYQYSDRILLDQQALLIEAAGSLKLYGSLPQFIDMLQTGLKRLGYRSRIGVAPTPAAARAFAPRQTIAVDRTQLQQHIQHLSPAALPLTDDRRLALQQTGVPDLKTLLRFSPAELRRRFGSELTNYLARLTGQQLDPRTPYQPPSRFKSYLNLPAPIHIAEGLLFAARRLLEELCGFLTATDAAASRIEWRLGHEDHPASRFTIELSSPDRDPARWMVILQEKLVNWELPAPIEKISLRADRIVSHKPRQNDWLDQSGEKEATGRVLERIQTRLGKESVTGIHHRQDYYPEKSWCYQVFDETRNQSHLSTHQPLWLLPQPVSMPDKPNPSVSVAMQQIKTGWWKQEDWPTRVYYISSGIESGGLRLWVYQTPNDNYYLQGLYD